MAWIGGWEVISLPGDSFSMNFLVVLGFDLLFVNLDAFFVKSPKTTKAPIRLRDFRIGTVSRLPRPELPAERPQTPAKPRKSEKDAF